MNNPEMQGTEGLNTPDRLRVYAGLLNDVSTLIAELENNQASDDSSHAFTFEIFGDHSVMIPKAISEALPDLDQILLTLGKDETDLRSTLSVDFLSSDKVVTVSRSGIDDDNAQPDALIHTTASKRSRTPTPLALKLDTIQGEIDDDFTERITPIERVSKSELNALIMSLAYPDSERGYAMFADVDFLNPAVFDSLRESLRLPAMDSRSSVEYGFESNDAQFMFHKEQEQPLAFTVTYPEKMSGRTITAQSNLETDFHLIFTTYDAVFREGEFTTDEKVPYQPSTEEIQYLRSILQTEIAAINPTSAGLFEDDQTIDQNDPEKLFIESGTMIFSKDYVKTVLDGLANEPTGPEA